MTSPSAREPVEPTGAHLERSIARLLSGGSYAAIALLATGLALMVANGIGPLDRSPRFDAGAVPADLLALRPTGFLWLGLIAVVATPAARVVASLVGYSRRGERSMAIVAALILLVIALSVTVGAGLES